MKKVFFVLVLMMSALFINAQNTKTTETSAKSVHTPVKVADLQKAITDNIAKDFTGFTIKEAKSVTKNNTLTYHVVIVRDTISETLIYDKNGIFVKIHSKKKAENNNSKKK